jgi:hypothetical protein
LIYSNVNSCLESGWEASRSSASGQRKASKSEELKRSRIQEWCDAELGARSLVLLEFLVS